VENGDLAFGDSSIGNQRISNARKRLDPGRNGDAVI